MARNLAAQLPAYPGRDCDVVLGEKVVELPVDEVEQCGARVRVLVGLRDSFPPGAGGLSDLEPEGIAGKPLLHRAAELYIEEVEAPSVHEMQWRGERESGEGCLQPAVRFRATVNLAPFMD